MQEKQIKRTPNIVSCEKMFPLKAGFLHFHLIVAVHPIETLST